MSKKNRTLIFWLALVVIPFFLSGHELRPAYLELKQTASEVYDVSWKVPARGPEKRLSLTVEFPDNCKVIGKTSSQYSKGSWKDRFSIQCDGGLHGNIIVIDGLTATLTDVLVRLEFLDGLSQVYHVTPSDPKLIVAAEQNALEITRVYLFLGIQHIWSGVDHLLFVLGLLILIQNWGPLIGAITAFTVAHSFTLAAATLGFVHVPSPPVEACIALSVVFVAREIIRRNEGDISLSETYPWIVAFVFGLLHGFGFAGALAETGLPLYDIPLALLFFNVGVEVGQILFVVLGLLVLHFTRKALSTQKKPMEQVIAYSIGGLSAFWVLERVSSF